MRAKGTPGHVEHCRRPHDPWDHISRASNKSLDHHSSSSGREALDAAILPMPTLPHLRRDHRPGGISELHTKAESHWIIWCLQARFGQRLAHQGFGSSNCRIPTVHYLHGYSVCFPPLHSHGTFRVALLRLTFEPPQVFGSSDCRFPTAHYLHAAHTW